ncbi:MAG: DUF2961 domain-containing protein [Chthoniobacteraceae bacterium]
MTNLQLPGNAIPDRVSISPSGKTPSYHAPFTRRTYAEMEGAGCIRHIWLTAARNGAACRKAILRIFFDGSEIPHVETPVADFFGVMHGQAWYPINTPQLSVQAETGYNCYFAMPFATSARVEIEAGDQPLDVYMMVDWHRYPGQMMEEKRRFCARWRREYPTERYGRDFLALDADGPGDFLGFVYGVRLFDNTDRWSHGGADNFYVDGDTETPYYLRGIGGEDTFGTSYGGATHPPETHLHMGMPYYHHEDTGEPRLAHRVVAYRFYDAESISFKRSIHFRFGCMRNEICATTYWYQEGTPRPFARMPAFEELAPGTPCNKAAYDLPLPAHGEWMLCGPFLYAEGKGFLKALPAETGRIDAREVFKVAHKKDSPYLRERARELGRDQARWVKAVSMRGFVDFNHYYRCAAHGVAVTVPSVAVARAVLRAPKAGRVRIIVSWDDQAALRINGAKTIDLGTHGAFRSREVEVDLHKGENEIAVKLSNTYGSNHGGWAFAFRCVTEEGKELLPQAPKTAGRGGKGLISRSGSR